MPKRPCTQRTEKARLDLLKQWKSHPEWTVEDAARELGVKIRTLKDWKSLYWDNLENIVGSDRIRKEGGGRPRKSQPYEDTVLRIYCKHLAEGGKCRVKDLVSSCQGIAEFTKKNPNSQKSWAREFIKFYSKAENQGKLAQVQMDYGGTIPKGGTSGENGDGVGSDEHEGGTSSIDRSSGGASDESGDGADTIDPEGGASSIDKSGGESGDGGEFVDNDQGGVDNGSSKDDFGKSGGCCGDDNVSAVGSDDDHNADDSDYSCFGVEMPKETSTETISKTFFRKRYPKDQAVLEWSNGSDFIAIFGDDLKSLHPGNYLTDTVMDYFILRYMSKSTGVTHICNTNLFRLIEVAKSTTGPVRLAERLSATCCQVKWGSFPFVFVPVSGVNHWSFLIVENALQHGRTNIYHVDSVRGAHDSVYAYDFITWFLVEERKRQASDLPSYPWGFRVFTTKPQQANTVDCGVFVLHYMDEISKAIEKLHQLQQAPRCIEMKLDAWTKGNFNVGAASKFRSRFEQEIRAAADKANKKIKSN